MDESGIEESSSVWLSSEDFRENPGTLALGLAWVLVFALIQLVQRQSPVAPVPIPDLLPVSTVISHRFGDMTWLEVRHWAAWRLVTATFIHFGLIHLVLNGVALISLGRLVEPWYRTGPFLAICLAIGGLGNLVGGVVRQMVGLARPWMLAQSAAWHFPNRVEKFIQGGGALSDSIHSGGGSTILLGLLTLAAVVGWRSRTRVGSHLQKQMLILLGLTAALGIGMYQLVDNYGHLGGGIVGAFFGLLDGPVSRLSKSKRFRGLCWAGVGVASLACVAIAIRHDRLEVGLGRQIVEAANRVYLDDATRTDLERLSELYFKRIIRSPYFADPANELDNLAIAELLTGRPMLTLARPLPLEELEKENAELQGVLDRLEKTPSTTWGDRTAEDLDSLRTLIRLALEGPVTYGDTYNFLIAWKPAHRAIVQDLATWNARRLEAENLARQSR